VRPTLRSNAKDNPTENASHRNRGERPCTLLRKKRHRCETAYESREHDVPRRPPSPLDGRTTNHEHRRIRFCFGWRSIWIRSHGNAIKSDGVTNCDLSVFLNKELELRLANSRSQFLIGYPTTVVTFGRPQATTESP